MKVLYVIFICVLYSCMQNVEPDNKISVGAAIIQTKILSQLDFLLY